eukprot:c48303_g1_i1 orf=522-797(+)
MISHKRNFDRPSSVKANTNQNVKITLRQLDQKKASSADHSLEDRIWFNYHQHLRAKLSAHRNQPSPAYGTYRAQEDITEKDVEIQFHNLTL